jgi:smad nuclear-interacting protein 1
MGRWEKEESPSGAGRGQPHGQVDSHLEKKYHPRDRSRSPVGRTKDRSHRGQTGNARRKARETDLADGVGKVKEQWGRKEDMEDEDGFDETDPEPDFGLSGALAAETNTVNGVSLKYSEPPEAAKPTKRWRLYCFKNSHPLEDPLQVHRQSSYLFGRDRRVVDVPTDHPSCSLQHAVLQYRATQKEGSDGLLDTSVRPYIIDLGSTNGTFLNGEKIDSERYYELLEKDLLQFGHSSREYVLMSDLIGE